MVIANKIVWVKEKIKSRWIDHYSSRVSLQFRQKKLKRVNGELREKTFLIESLRNAWKAAEDGRGGQQRELGKVTNRQRYAICVQGYFYSFARVLYGLVLRYEGLEPSQLCLG